MTTSSLDSIAYGQTTVTGADTATVLTATTQAVPDGFYLVVKAHSTNTESIFIGDASVTLTTGFELPKNHAVKLKVSKVATVYIRSTSTSQKVSWIIEEINA